MLRPAGTQLLSVKVEPAALGLIVQHQPEHRAGGPSKSSWAESSPFTLTSNKRSCTREFALWGQKRIASLPKFQDPKSLDKLLSLAPA